jgi:MFS family permease
MTDRRRAALSFVLLMGLVSLFSDVCYEGARAALGPYLRWLGASAASVGFVAGLGELVGYALRYGSGRLADRTGRYWLLSAIGYGVNVVAVPLMAFAGRWEVAAALVVLERLGKAIRSPAKSTLLSFAARELGAGKSFGLHTAMDQAGAVLGPLLVAGAIWLRHGEGPRAEYRLAYLALGVPALLSVATLAIAWRRHPDPRHLEGGAAAAEPVGFGRLYWLYLAAIALVAMGMMDWPLMAYHLDRAGLFGDAAVPSLYAAAMAADGAAGLVSGILFDRHGLAVLAAAIALSAGFAPLLLLASGPAMAVAGLLLWAIGMGACDAVAKAAIVSMVPSARRGTAYGTYFAVFGVAWWLGSWAMGALYDRAIPWAVGFAVATQLAAVPLLVVTSQRLRRAASP